VSTSKININSWLQSSYVLLVIQQAIVASSSIWLTWLILGVSEGQPSLTWLWLYLVSLILPYLPGAFALIQVSKTQIKSCVNYIQEFSQLYPGKILKWSDREQRSTISSILSGEACPTINGYIEYLYHLVSSGLNVFFNLFVLAALINSSLLITYAIGVTLSLIILYSQKSFKTKLALKAQESRIQWTSLLIKSWDNILINNLYNLNIWNRKASIQGKNLTENTITLEKFNQLIGIIMAFALILPSMMLITYLAMMNLENLAFLATLIVLFPRLFQVLTYSYELLFFISDFPVQKAKLNTVLSVIKSPELDENNDALWKRVHWNKIYFKQPLEGIISAKDLLFKLPNNGRITLHGENGSGKTSFLLLLKMQHNTSAFYLPSKHDLLFEELENNKLSTGQQAFKALKEIKEKVDTPIILLDEWDANLDKKNRHELSMLIDELSLNHCIVEVLHVKQEDSPP
jgi:ABC-type transport system involved in cytochrome bd biosynthesis fused ATPase/permease subunit